MANVALNAHLTTNSTTGAPYLQPLEVSAALVASSALVATKLQPTFIQASLVGSAVVAGFLEPINLHGAIQASAVVSATAHKQGEHTAFLVSAQLNGGSSIFIPGALALSAHLIGGSSLSFLQIPLAAHIFANSSLSEGYNLSASLIADSEIVANHLEPVSAEANLVTDSTIGGHLTPVDIAAHLVANSTHLFDAPGTRFLVANVVADSETTLDSATLLFAVLAGGSFCEVDTGFVSVATHLVGGSVLSASVRVSFSLSAHLAGGSSLMAAETLSLIAVPVSPTKIRVIFPFVVKNDVNLNNPLNYTVASTQGNLTVASVSPETVINTMVVDVILGTPLQSDRAYQLTISPSIQQQ